MVRQTGAVPDWYSSGQTEAVVHQSQWYFLGWPNRRFQSLRECLSCWGRQGSSPKCHVQPTENTPIPSGERSDGAQALLCLGFPDRQDRQYRPEPWDRLLTVFPRKELGSDYTFQTSIPCAPSARHS